MGNVGPSRLLQIKNKKLGYLHLCYLFFNVAANQMVRRYLPCFQSDIKPGVQSKSSYCTIELLSSVCVIVPV